MHGVRRKRLGRFCLISLSIALSSLFVCLFVCCRTFSELSKPEELLQKCKNLCDSLAESLAEEGLKVSVHKGLTCSPGYLQGGELSYTYIGSHGHTEAKDSCLQSAFQSCVSAQGCLLCR